MFFYHGEPETKTFWKPVEVAITPKPVMITNHKARIISEKLDKFHKELRDALKKAQQE